MSLSVLDHDFEVAVFAAVIGRPVAVVALLVAFDGSVTACDSAVGLAAVMSFTIALVTELAFFDDQITAFCGHAVASNTRSSAAVHTCTGQPGELTRELRVTTRIAAVVSF